MAWRFFGYWIEAPEHIKAAQTATCEKNAPFLTVMLEDRYTEAYLQATGKDAPKFTDEDLKIISSPLDFVGINEPEMAVDTMGIAYGFLPAIGSNS